MSSTPQGPDSDTPRSAYVHVPFCKHRCGYCNFTLVAGREDLVDAYLNCLETELSRQLQFPRSVDTLFLGGGTPTHLSTANLGKLLELLSIWLPLNNQAEYSCEANPLDCSIEKLTLLKQFGVNRISLGGQSFNDRKLKKLERDHSGQELYKTVLGTSQLFSNISLDLIFAAPEETMLDWQNDLSRALSLPISHLSTYGLTIEAGAKFWGRMLRGDIKELDTDLQLEMYHHTMDTLAHAGWEHYEVSNFARTGHQCQHNKAYWRGAPWWAFGPGASSFLPIRWVRNPSSYLSKDTAQKNTAYDSKASHSSTSDSRTIIGDASRWLRATNHRSTTQYIRLIQSGSSAVHEQDELDLEQVIRERLVFGLRQLVGVDLAELARQWGGPIDALFEPYLSQYVEHNWLVREQNNLRLTRQGLVISDSLWPNLLQI